MSSIYFGALFLPRVISLSRSKVINAQVQTVFEQVQNLKNWVLWAPWHKNDSSIKFTYGDKTQGLGAQYSWSGKMVGKGNMQVTYWEKNKRVDFQMALNNDQKGTSIWEFRPVDKNKTQVTWSFLMVADFPYLHMRYLSLFLDSMLGEWFEKGLNDLKDRSEFYRK